MIWVPCKYVLPVLLHSTCWPLSLPQPQRLWEPVHTRTYLYGHALLASVVILCTQSPN